MGSKIEWTEETWNPVVGCDKVSDGCKHCYAIVMANRLSHIAHSTDLYMPTVTVGANGKPNWTGVVQVAESNMDKPLRFKKPTMFFVNSMSDLFHDKVPFDVVDRVFAIMALCPQHTFQVLTKRPARMLEYFNAGTGGGISYWANKIDAEKWSEVERYGWPYKNVWLGVSVENQKAADERIPLLLQVPAAVRFLSCEPLLGRVSLFNVPVKAGTISISQFDDAGNKVPRIDWVIAGGESGTGSRPMHPDWVRGLRDECGSTGVPFFFKQWGDWKPIDMPADQDDIKPLGKNEQWLNFEGGMGFHGENVWRMRRVGKGSAGNKLDGRVWEEYPGKV